MTDSLAELNARLLRPARAITYAAAVLLLIAATVFSARHGFNAIKLADDAGFIAFSFLCLALAVTPIKKLAPSFELNPTLHRARRALGVSCFGFAAVHVALQTGFPSAFSLDNLAAALSVIGVPLGAVALVVLFVLAATSCNWAVRKMGRRWFDLQKLSYLAYPLIVSHAIIAGTDFHKLGFYSGIFLAIAAATLVLEIARLYKERVHKHEHAAS